MFCLFETPEKRIVWNINLDKEVKHSVGAPFAFFILKV